MNLNFFNHQTKTVGRAAIILTFSALFSRFLGIIRDWLLARTFGASPELDVYFAAFKIPDFVYNVLIMGGISVAFLPLFSEYFSKNEKEAWEFTSNSLNVFLVLLISLSLLLFILTPQLVRIIAPGFSLTQKDLTISLTGLMLLSPIFFGLSAILSGVLQYFNRFLVYSLCPLLYNLGIIFGILFLQPRFGVLGVALGVILGAFSHFAIQIPSVLNCGFSLKPIFNFKDSRLKRVFVLMIPRTFGVASQQLNLIFINAIASTLATGSIAIFNFANNIQYFPIGIVGVSVAIAAFPALAKNWAEDQKEKFIEKFYLAFKQILYFVLPASILIFFFRNLIVNILLRHGNFSLEAARLTEGCLGLFSLSIFASSLIPLIFRAFFSFQDTKTPTLISLISMGLNIILAYFLTWFLKFDSLFKGFLANIFSLKGIENISVLGLSLAVTVSTIFQFVLMMIFLKKRIKQNN